MLNLASLTLRREGLFHQLVTGEHHCGPKSALVDHSGQIPDPAQSGKAISGRNARTITVKGPAIAVKYHLTVTCGPTLDHRGFLFDQTMVDAWFVRKGLYASGLSCEALVIKYANELQEKIARDAAHCDVRGVTLQFSPAPHQASVSAHYTRGPEPRDNAAGVNAAWRP